MTRSGSATRPSTRGDESRAALLEAAISVLREDGFAAATARNIAARGMVAWDAGRESRAPAPARHGQGLDAAASITASDALAASPVLQGRVS